uniref:Aquaporin n=1 Tax=Alexandrium catenella TaxID=2925 RepID=A0A7S1RGC2_ALECA|mmetsp:Transcript_56409/g.150977  ORF Transcript_56409/g.150977 Transcript_56409/m.150977 type:complete len:408 (+) Transcript_56409:90-1313(+)
MAQARAFLLLCFLASAHSIEDVSTSEADCANGECGVQLLQEKVEHASILMEGLHNGIESMVKSNGTAQEDAMESMVKSNGTTQEDATTAVQAAGAKHGDATPAAQATGAKQGDNASVAQAAGAKQGDVAFASEAAGATQGDAAPAAQAAGAKLGDVASFVQVAGAKQEDTASAAQAAGTLSFRDVAAEFIAMTLFVFFGCGSAMSIAKEPSSAWVLQVSLTFGLAITVLAYTVGHYSGAQINCAVTLGLVIYGHIGVLQGFLNFLGQMVGSVLGAMMLKAMYPHAQDKTSSLGTNSVSPDWTSMGALIGEFMGTFLLMYVVFETAVNSMAAANAALAPLAIGLSVFLAHSVLIPIDGCSINPTRSFGPALVESLSGGSNAFRDMWVFWLGPLSGAAVAAGVYALMSS